MAASKIANNITKYLQKEKKKLLITYFLDFKYASIFKVSMIFGV